MLITKHKTSKDLNSTELADIANILLEVKQHGFYSNYCINLVDGADDKETLVSKIRQIASKALLRVTFNADKTICIFED